MLSPKWKGNVPLSASNAYGAFETRRLREPGTGFAKKRDECDLQLSTLAN